MTLPKKIKIVFVIATLGAGGAERVMTLLAAEWAKRGHDVTIITMDDGRHDHYELPGAVRRMSLNLMGASRGKLDGFRRNVRRITMLRKAILSAAPDLVVSFMDRTNVSVLLAMNGIRIPVIVSERIDPRYYPMPMGWAWLRKRLYPRVAALVVQTENVAEWAREFVAGERVHVIANPVQESVPMAAPDGRGGNHDMPRYGFIGAMGRLDRQKGFDLLLRAYAKLPEGSTPELVILGEGPERDRLGDLVRELGLAGRVHLPGRKKNPAETLRRASLFVMASRFEGFPNALLEAMALGLPVISFDCPSGPADIIRHGENGLLVRPEDVDSLSAAIKQMLDSPAKAKKLGAVAREVVTDYSVEKITDLWEQVVTQAQKVKRDQL